MRSSPRAGRASSRDGMSTASPAKPAERGARQAKGLRTPLWWGTGLLCCSTKRFHEATLFPVCETGQSWFPPSWGAGGDNAHNKTWSYNRLLSTLESTHTSTTGLKPVPSEPFLSKKTTAIGVWAHLEPTACSAAVIAAPLPACKAKPWCQTGEISPTPADLPLLQHSVAEEGGSHH